MLCVQIHRVSQYEKYLEDLLKETRPDHPDHDDLVKVAAKAKQVSLPSSLSQTIVRFPSIAMHREGGDKWAVVSYPYRRGHRHPTHESVGVSCIRR